ncbi:VOC family protein [Labrys miyagiensis]|nr:VOC family protein [Labrys miyagiensis]
MPISARPFLMFQGDAEAAMTLYRAVFGEAARILKINRYGPGEAGAEGSVKVALFQIADQEIKCIDSPMKHAFGFTPAISLYVNFDSEDELGRVAVALAEGGAVYMPLDDYGFSRKFTWVGDRYGVTWQLNLP